MCLCVLIITSKLSSLTSRLNYTTTFRISCIACIMLCDSEVISVNTLCSCSKHYLLPSAIENAKIQNWTPAAVLAFKR